METNPTHAPNHQARNRRPAYPLITTHCLQKKTKIKGATHSHMQAPDATTQDKALRIISYAKESHRRFPEGASDARAPGTRHTYGPFQDPR